MNADALPDEMPVRSLCPRMVCTACGLVGSDVRPDWSPHTNRRRRIVGVPSASYTKSSPSASLYRIANSAIVSLA
jgi:hypothetical protein